jgi:hypothetical protein
LPFGISVSSMTWLYEQPLVIVLVGVAILVALGAAWSATGRKELLVALGVALALMVVGLVVERLVVTDREAIEATLLEIARDVQSNNQRAVARHIYSGAPALKQRAEAEMPHYRFTECRITRINAVNVDERAQPRAAIAEFNLIASGSFHEEGLEISDASVPRWVRLHMVRERDGRWAVQDYEHAPPQQMIFERPLEGEKR